MKILLDTSLAIGEEPRNKLWHNGMEWWCLWWMSKTGQQVRKHYDFQFKWWFCASRYFLDANQKFQWLLEISSWSLGQWLQSGKKNPVEIPELLFVLLWHKIIVNYYNKKWIWLIILVFNWIGLFCCFDWCARVFHENKDYSYIFKSSQIMTSTFIAAMDKVDHLQFGEIVQQNILQKVFDLPV